MTENVGFFVFVFVLCDILYVYTKTKVKYITLNTALCSISAFRPKERKCLMRCVAGRLRRCVHVTTPTNTPTHLSTHNQLQWMIHFSTVSVIHPDARSDIKA